MIHADDALWFLMEKDPGLTPYSGEIRMHMDRYRDMIPIREGEHFHEKACFTYRGNDAGIVCLLVKC